MDSKNILRWIAVLPAAILAFVVVHVINFVQGNVFAIPFEIARDALSVAFFAGSGVAFIYGASKTAPSHNNAVSLLLCIFLCVVMIAGLYVQFTHPGEYLLIDKVYNVAVMLGSVMGVIFIKTDGIE